MAKRILTGILIALSILLASCYPELSVQQYDQLKKDLAALDVERQELQEELTAIKAHDLEMKTEINAYIGFLEKLVSTQISKKILTGEFDTQSLIDSKEELIIAAEGLSDNEINLFLGLMNSENKPDIVGAYYKVIEYCLKNIKQTLE